MRGNHRLGRILAALSYSLGWVALLSRLNVSRSQTKTEPDSRLVRRVNFRRTPPPPFSIGQRRDQGHFVLGPMKSNLIPRVLSLYTSRKDTGTFSRYEERGPWEQVGEKAVT